MTNILIDELRAAAKRNSLSLHNRKLMAIAADALERKKGEWIDGPTITYQLNGDRYATAYCFYCSKCGKEVGKKENYCPNCGASMRKDGDV